MKKFILLVLFGKILVSCGSTKGMNFADKAEDDSIEGMYINPKFQGNILMLLDRKLLKDTLQNQDDYEKFSIHFEGNKYMVFQIYSEKNVITRKHKYKKRKGVYYLKNQNVKPLLIPFILGAIDEKRLYLYKNKKNKLIINTYESRSGAALLVVFLSWKDWTNTFRYDRIEDETY